MEEEEKVRSVKKGSGGSEKLFLTVLDSWHNYGQPIYFTIYKVLLLVTNAFLLKTSFLHHISRFSL